MKSILAFSLALFLLGFNSALAQHDHNAVSSDYAGEEMRTIKSLSPDEIEGLKAGAGTPFNGMAKPAELNGYPGPRHVLDAYEAGQFELSDGQLAQVRSLFNEMKKQAIPLGEQIIQVEQEMDDAFSSGEINAKDLKQYITKSAELYSQLRFVHLYTHLKMMEVLSAEQVEAYNRLRGYTSANPCENIPEGHDHEMWEKHNNCQE